MYRWKSATPYAHPIWDARYRELWRREAAYPQHLNSRSSSEIVDWNDFINTCWNDVYSFFGQQICLIKVIREVPWSLFSSPLCPTCKRMSPIRSRLLVSVLYVSSGVLSTVSNGRNEVVKRCSCSPSSMANSRLRLPVTRRQSGLLWSLDCHWTYVCRYKRAYLLHTHMQQVTLISQPYLFANHHQVANICTPQYRIGLP